MYSILMYIIILCIYVYIYIPGPSSLGAKWFLKAVVFNHSLGVKNCWHPFWKRAGYMISIHVFVPVGPSDHLETSCNDNNIPKLHSAKWSDSLDYLLLMAEIPNNHLGWC